MMTREELIDKITDLFVDGSDDDGSWDSDTITEVVMALLVREGSDRLAQCGHCSTWYPISMYGDCPYYDSHPCGGGCGNTNEECTCEDCPDCHIYYEDCECPRCQSCGEKRGECACEEEMAVFK